jgi:hypothetical protein
MKRLFFVAVIIFLLLTTEGQTQNYSILTGTVTEFSWRWLVVKSEDGRIIPLRVGWKTTYPNHIPFVVRPLVCHFREGGL